MPRTIAARRQDEILARLRISGTVSVEELAESFSVSRETIRRDLKNLAKRGCLEVVHGGASRRSSETALVERLGENPQGKAAIGRAAAELVDNGMVVLLDSGATTLRVAEALAAKLDLTIATNSLPIALMMCRVPGTRVHMLGGEVDSVDEAAFGIEVIEALERFRFDIAFVGAAGISEEGEVTDFTRVAAEQRSRMLKAAKRAYLVADHGKFGRLTPIRIRDSEIAAGLIVDRPPAEPFLEAFRTRGTQIIVAE
ncbi:DeoR family transcriptional regulator [Enterovirga aerilata]|uniref:DeoR/GlpR transcriptional regulator n=1 Tax=Enterovirga aerilata TaxID=2730920 RepID=A0A849I392_9HYPH|nr:DeoR/GlpR family DNA-binding transcription regulator [Enterovirga sp. DB1703]NNM71811.1 DeoR/GlpR transcriptional regulator [Enterovirga sp. DB1703]